LRAEGWLSAVSAFPFSGNTYIERSDHNVLFEIHSLDVLSVVGSERLRLFAKFVVNLIHIFFSRIIA
jgi:hypothetical protein